MKILLTHTHTHTRMHTYFSGKCAEYSGEGKPYIHKRKHMSVTSWFGQEIEVDAVAQNGRVVACVISEHVENAGVHSGDATIVSPAQDLTEKTLEGVRDIMFAVAQALYISGPFNMQLIAKDDELKVIECNVRASRSFPFVSKALDLELIPIATRIFMGLTEGVPTTLAVGAAEYVGVKVAQFSFNRLPGSDPTVGVDMMSTGEVACFGADRCEAYLKGLISTGFKVPIQGQSILLSIGTYRAKAEFLPCVKLLVEMGFKLFGSKGTSEFYSENGINTSYVDLPTDSEQGVDQQSLKDMQFGLVINIPAKSRFRRPASYNSQGYLTRTMAVQHAVPLITDIKCAKLFVEALYTYGHTPRVHTSMDCRSANRIVVLPGLIDVHVHAREPGAVHKEDWSSCTAAALAGGITLVCAMPNTDPPVVDRASLDAVRAVASSKARCDYSMWVGATMNNMEAAKAVGMSSVGLSMELDNATCNSLRIDDLTVWMAHFESWPSELPIVVRAESKTLAAVLMMAMMYDRAIHVCALSRREEIMVIREAKRRGAKVTCGVSPHHLFLTDEDVQGKAGFGAVHPPLATKQDRQALWDNIGIIDVFSSHHAPHTKEEKAGEDAPPGFPGLETMLPLLLTAVSEGKLTIEDVVTRLHTNPKKIFGLADQPNTHIEIDLDVKWELPKVRMHNTVKASVFYASMRRDNTLSCQNLQSRQDGKLTEFHRFG
jgi:carbamoyl-phosphate synthase/aspartate carbamoyltransferase/dihydroorotase